MAAAVDRLLHDRASGRALRFSKMHGLGNDYVYIDTFATPVAEPERLAPRISDRRRGRVLIVLARNIHAAFNAAILAA